METGSFRQVGIKRVEVPNNSTMVHLVLDHTERMNFKIAFYFIGHLKQHYFGVVRVRNN